ELGAPELHVLPHRGETASLGMSGGELGQAVDAIVDGAIIGEWGKEGEAKIDVVLRAELPQKPGVQRDEFTRLTPTELAAAPVTPPSGHVVPLGTLASLEERLGPTLIRRIERARSITLQVTPPDDLAL